MYKNLIHYKLSLLFLILQKKKDKKYLLEESCYEQRKYTHKALELTSKCQ